MNEFPKKEKNQASVVGANGSGRNWHGKTRNVNERLFDYAEVQLEAVAE